MVEVSGAGKHLHNQVIYFYIEGQVCAMNRILEQSDFYPVSQRAVLEDQKLMRCGKGSRLGMSKEITK